MKFGTHTLYHVRNTLIIWRC